MFNDITITFWIKQVSFIFLQLIRREWLITFKELRLPKKNCYVTNTTGKRKKKQNYLTNSAFGKKDMKSAYLQKKEKICYKLEEIELKLSCTGTQKKY